MTDPSKTLSADEIANWKAHTDTIHFIGGELAQRIWATIEQQAEQIEKLREVVRMVRNWLGPDLFSDADVNATRARNLCREVDEVLAATEPVNDKR